MKIPTNRYICLYLRIWSEPVIVLFELCCSREQRGISSNGRAPALHAGSTGIDTRILHFFLTLLNILTLANIYIFFYSHRLIVTICRIFELLFFFKYLLVGATDEWVSESVRDVCMSH